MDTHPRKTVPEGASQHVTAGPYSPVIEVDARRLVVLSGQVAVDRDGNVVGATIEEQTVATLENCRRQLAVAGCGLGDVFKVNVYLSDLADWARFNTVYAATLPRPLPVRTAVQAILMTGFLVEIEMWAVKP
jgi:2-iminobutanoate/2-iminopropanoate deaminase